MTPYEVGALIAGGVLSIEVVQKPRVLLIPTGSELIPPETLAQREIAPGETPEFNTVVLAGSCNKPAAFPCATPYS